jgi:hypothetical protein
MRFRTSILHKNQDAAVEADRAAGFTIIRSKIAPVVFAFKTLGDNGRVWLKAYRGKGVRTAANYTFGNMGRAEAYAEEFARTEAAGIARRKAREAEKKAKRSSLKASDFWAVGDVVYTSWGYDQTNVEYYQIVEVKDRSVMIRQVAVNSSDQPGSPYGGQIQPRRNEFVGAAYLSPINEHGGFTAGPTWGKDKPAHRHPAYKWNGKAKYTSSYH